LINLANAKAFILLLDLHVVKRASLNHHLETTHAVLHLTLLQLELPLAESQLALPELEVRGASGIVAAGAREAAGGVV
jgi:hypothetical protein